MKILPFYLLLLIPVFALSQKTDTSKTTGFPKLPGDTVPSYTLPVIDVFAAVDPFQAENLKKYLKLRRDVIRAYPYAKLAAKQVHFINDSTLKIKSERAKKKFIKKTEKELKEKFEKDLKNLTYSQGHILIKLIDRETGVTSYDLVKQLRGSLKAFWWQGFARLFGTNLKSEYDPQGEDVVIESIVQAIERGELQVQTK